jgi:hypothetical protein
LVGFYLYKPSIVNLHPCCSFAAEATGGILISPYRTAPLILCQGYA